MSTLDKRAVRNRLAWVWGDAVARRRAAVGLTQIELARRCAVEQQTISKIEHGRLIPRDELKHAIAAALGTVPWLLFAWPGQPDVVRG